jgi:hypothetical protein
LQKDEAFANEYRELGRSYKAQREFRLRWASNELQKRSETRVQEQTREETEDEAGSYMGLSVIEDAEKCTKAAAAYKESCVEMHKMGILFRNQPMVRWNNMTKREEYLYIKATFRSSLNNLWKHRVEWGDADAEQQPAPPAIAEAAPEVETPQKQKEAKAAGIKEAKAAGKGGKPPKEVSPNDKSKKGKCPLDAELNSLRIMKQKWNTALTEASHLLDTIVTNEAWKDLRPATVLTQARDQLLSFRTKTEFWEFASLHDTNKIKARFSENAIFDELRAKSGLMTAISELETETAGVKAAFTAKQAVKAKARRSK